MFAESLASVCGQEPNSNFRILPMAVKLQEPRPLKGGQGACKCVLVCVWGRDSDADLSMSNLQLENKCVF